MSWIWCYEISKLTIHHVIQIKLASSNFICRQGEKLNLFLFLNAAYCLKFILLKELLITFNKRESTGYLSLIVFKFRGFQGNSKTFREIPQSWATYIMCLTTWPVLVLQSKSFSLSFAFARFKSARFKSVRSKRDPHFSIFKFFCWVNLSMKWFMLFQLQVNEWKYVYGYAHHILHIIFGFLLLFQTFSRSKIFCFVTKHMCQQSIVFWCLNTLIPWNFPLIL